jgi:hypothetical protein
MAHLYNEIEHIQDAPRCPTCRTQGREIAQLALVLAIFAFVLGGCLGWGLHAWLT